MDEPFRQACRPGAPCPPAEAGGWRPALAAVLTWETGAHGLREAQARPCGSAGARLPEPSPSRRPPWCQWLPRAQGHRVQSGCFLSIFTFFHLSFSSSLLGPLGLRGLSPSPLLRALSYSRWSSTWRGSELERPCSPWSRIDQGTLPGDCAQGAGTTPDPF